MSTTTQGTSSTELARNSEVSLGNRRYDLVGLDVFNPRQHAGNRVVVKGVLIPSAHAERINVTSLQSVTASCSP
jgi:hypothetical protein